jgi:hypothetical protein
MGVLPTKSWVELAKYASLARKRLGIVFNESAQSWFILIWTNYKYSLILNGHFKDLNSRYLPYTV